MELDEKYQQMTSEAKQFAMNQKFDTTPNIMQLTVLISIDNKLEKILKKLEGGL